MKKLLVFFISISFLMSCQKEISGDTPVTSNLACKACSYLPVCDGSVYTYSDTVLGTGSDVTTTIDVIKDTTIAGKVFQQIAYLGEVAFYNCTSGNSTQISYQPTGINGEVIKLEQILLKANEPVGATWTSQIPGVGGIMQDLNFKIVAKGLSKTILGVTYNDVIHVYQTISLTVPGTGTVIAAEVDSYYANNIGLIEAISYATIFPGTPPTVTLHRVLKTYSIP